MLKAVIFDMDGVLLDSEPFHYFIEGEIYKKLGIDVPEEVRLNFVGLENKKMWAILKEKYNLKQDLNELIYFNEKERAEYMASLHGLKPNPGIIVLLNELKKNKIKIALASSSTVEVIKILIDKIELFPYFDVIVSGDEVSNGKPLPDIFIHTAKQLDLPVGDCLVIEDSNNGFRSAKAAGMKCVAYKNKNTRGQDVSLADFFIEDFNHLTIPVLEKMMN